ncbi:MAG: hypothetical protein JRN54_03905 [Nitrososphaerota archaeon]|nr:hypothetical protein [Nitrososphaerota archaeon]
MNEAQKQALVGALAVLAVVGLLGTSFVAQAVLALSGVNFGAVHYAFTFTWFPRVAGASLNFDQVAVPFVGLDVADFLALVWTVTDVAWMAYLIRNWRK